MYIKFVRGWCKFVVLEWGYCRVDLGFILGWVGLAQYQVRRNVK